MNKRLFGILAFVIFLTIVVFLSVSLFLRVNTKTLLVQIKAAPDDLSTVYRGNRKFNIHQPNISTTFQDDATRGKTEHTNQPMSANAAAGLSFGVVLNDNVNRFIPLQNHSQILQYGNKKYSVISVSTPTSESISRYNYVFSIPIAILAWKRIGFGTIVLISGSENEWEKDPCLKLIKEYMNDLHAIAMFFNVPGDNLIMMSQVSRIYAASLLTDKLKDDDYLVTGDVDLWPIDGPAYMLPRNKKILVLNAGCCGSYRYKDRLYTLVAMGNVGASVKTWKEIITSKGDKMPRYAKDILDIFAQEFGDVAKMHTMKGENEGWYLDQHMLTLLLASWRNKNDIDSMEFKPRNIGADRIDRTWWSTNTIDGKIDIHVLDNIHLTTNWLKVLPLFRLMFGSDEYSSLYSMTLLYFSDFSNAMEAINTHA